MSMNIQRFHASTVREALALARATFGDDTLILSNRQLANGVEVVAAAEGDLTSLEMTLPPAITQAPAQARAAQLPAPAPAAVAAPARAAAQPSAKALAATQETVQADTEKLSMSTLSFQDYVRERMLRRQHEAPSSAPVTAPAPASQQPALHARAPAAPAPAPTPREHPPQPVAPTVEDTLQTPADVPALSQNASRVAPRDETPKASPAQLAQTTQPVPDMSKVLMAELHSMKRLMEERFNTLSWLGQARQDPIHSNLMLKLVRAGYSPSLARSVLEPIAMGSDANDVVREVMKSLERMLAADASAPSMIDEGGVFALIGATGVGKTTTAAKLAAQCAQAHGAASVGLITLDTHRAGAHEQLRAYGRSLNVVAHLAHDRAALQELLALLSVKKMVLIDTAGIAPRDPRRRDLLDLLEMPAIKRVMVLNAGAHGDTLDEVANSFKIGGTRQAVLSKVDEAAKLGPALDTLMRHQLTLRGVTNGQRVPQDWKTAHGADLVRESMRAAQRSAFDPRTPDMDFFFSPAACAI